MENDDLDDFGGSVQPLDDNVNANSGGGDIVDDLLRAQGIMDKDHIKYEENGEIVDKSWNELDKEDQFNILRTPTYLSGPQISEDETALISSIRQSGMTPSEYFAYVQNQAAEAANMEQSVPTFQVDDYPDDELFVYDFINRMGEVTDEEAREALDKAKSNPTLYEKQVSAIRDEYRRVEQETLMQQQIEQQQIAEDNFNNFANVVANEINNFTNISGFDLNLDQRDAQMLYDFITATDAAGNNYFSKALADPATLVKAAHFTLNGEQMLHNINAFYQNELARVQQAAYKKGYDDRSKEQGSFIYKPTKSSGDKNDDSLDDF